MPERDPNQPDNGETEPVEPEDADTDNEEGGDNA